MYEKFCIVGPIKEHYPSDEYVTVQCGQCCGSTSSQKISNLRERFKKKGVAWYCVPCQKKNAAAFAKIREARLTPEERSAKSRKGIETFKQKTGLNNPMDLPGVREAQLAATTTKEFRERCTERNLELYENPEYRANTGRKSAEYWAANPEARHARMKMMQDLAKAPEFRAIVGNKISRIHREHPERMTGVSKILEWSKNPTLCKERYRRLLSSNRKNDFTSKGELSLLSFVQSYYPEAAKGYVDGKELDIFIPSIKLAIEYNGAYWHQEKYSPKNKHLEKTLAAEAEGIRVIQVFDFEWKHRNHQVQDLLKSAMGVNTKIYARKCVIKEVETNEAEGFLRVNHIQGAVRPRSMPVRIGLFFEDKLVALATFGKHHRGTGQWVLNRFCCEHGVTVVGGLSRICKSALKKIGEDIISWADRRLSQGRGYVAAGWIEDEVLGPDYFYFDGKEPIAKQARMKSKVGTPDGITESQHAELDGLMKVYDCGKIRFVYPFKA